MTIVGLERDDDTIRYVAGYPNFQAITAWNHSNRYAMAVTELAEQAQITTDNQPLPQRPGTSEIL